MHQWRTWRRAGPRRRAGFGTQTETPTQQRCGTRLLRRHATGPRPRASATPSGQEAMPQGRGRTATRRGGSAAHRRRSRSRGPRQSWYPARVARRRHRRAGWRARCRQRPGRRLASVCSTACTLRRPQPCRAAGSSRAGWRRSHPQSRTAPRLPARASTCRPLGLAERACRLGARALRGAGLACCRRRTIRCASGSLPRSRQASTRHPSSSPSACLPRSQSAPGGLSSRPPATRCPRSSQSQTWTGPSSPAGGKLAIGAPALELEPPTARPDGCMLTKICAPEAVWHDVTNARGLPAAKDSKVWSWQ